jgi:ribosome biogenesis GTPase
MSSVPPILAALGWDDRVAALAADLPSHLVTGRVTRVDRGRASVVTALDELRPRTSTPVAVGDWVGVDPASDAVDAVLPRWSAVTRKAAGRETLGQTLATNLDVLFVVQALSKPVNLRRLERELVVAWDSGARPVVVLTKADLRTDVDDQRRAAESVAPGVDVVAVSVVTGIGLDALSVQVAAGRTFAVMGASGVGKSTLVNHFAGEELLDTGGIRLTDGRGRHTTTAGQLVVVPSGAILIDTPGLRELALWDDGDGLVQVFADIEELAAECRFGDCQHRGEPGCAVRDAVDADRLDSWRRLQREAARTADNRAGWQRAADSRKHRVWAKSLRDQPYRP